LARPLQLFDLAVKVPDHLRYLHTVSSGFPDWIGVRFPFCLIPSHSCLDRKTILAYTEHFRYCRACQSSHEGIRLASAHPLNQERFP
jgi:hypothetical protein